MLQTYTQTDIGNLAEDELGDALEEGRIVYFPQCPIGLPSDDELEFLRNELPSRLKLKNISYHPEARRLVGLDADQTVRNRVEGILRGHAEQLNEFLHRVAPGICQGWPFGTTSFRPIEERGRDLKPHASNELVHIDAGAYGATNGDRIFRFFVNVNPTEDRVWASKGRFPELYQRFGHAAGIAPLAPGCFDKRWVDHLRTAIVRALTGVGLGLAGVLDSSPYDRVMRRFHNYMKDTPAFQADREGHQEFRFPPYSAWMVLTDMVSHASLAGQFALVDTALIPLANCRKPEFAPINILNPA